MSKFFSRLFLAVLLGFSFGISSTYAMHTDDPILFAACPSDETARAIINAYVATIDTKDGFSGFNKRLAKEGLVDRCLVVNNHIDGLDAETRDLVRAQLKDTPAIWSGPMLPEVDGWPYLSWHIETVTVNMGAASATMYHFVIIKKASAPNQ